MTPAGPKEIEMITMRDRVLYLRGKAHGLAVGMHMRVGHRSARLYEITKLEEAHDADKMEWKTTVHLKAVANGDFPCIIYTEHIAARIIGGAEQLAEGNP